MCTALQKKAGLCWKSTEGRRWSSDQGWVLTWKEKDACWLLLIAEGTGTAWRGRGDQIRQRKKSKFMATRKAKGRNRQVTIWTTFHCLARNHDQAVASRYGPEPSFLVSPITVVASIGHVVFCQLEVKKLAYLIMCHGSTPRPLSLCEFRVNLSLQRKVWS